MTQYLVTVSDDGLTVRRLELTVPSGMRVQLTEGTLQYVTDHWRLRLRLPPLYNGRSRDEAMAVIK